MEPAIQNNLANLIATIYLHLIKHLPKQAHKNTANRNSIKLSYAVCLMTKPLSLSSVFAIDNTCSLGICLNTF